MIRSRTSVDAALCGCVLCVGVIYYYGKEEKEEGKMIYCDG